MKRRLTAGGSSHAAYAGPRDERERRAVPSCPPAPNTRYVRWPRTSRFPSPVQPRDGGGEPDLARARDPHEADERAGLRNARGERLLRCSRRNGSRGSAASPQRASPAPGTRRAGAEPGAAGEHLQARGRRPARRRSRFRPPRGARRSRRRAGPPARQTAGSRRPDVVRGRPFGAPRVQDRRQAAARSRVGRPSGSPQQLVAPEVASRREGGGDPRRVRLARVRKGTCGAGDSRGRTAGGRQRAWRSAGSRRAIRYAL